MNISYLFAQFVGYFVELEANNKQLLADEFETTLAIVDRWAVGLVYPRQSTQKLILKFILDKL